MKGFILGIIVTLIVIAAVGLFVLETGRVNMRGDVPPSSLETSIAGHAMDASVTRNSPKIADPIQPTEQNLVDGALIYAAKCAQCHGDAANTKSKLAETLSPPPPQFFGDDRPDMPENQNYYITLHGVRLTGMPGWKNALTDEQIWKVVTFLSHLDNLPPKAKSVFSLTGSPNASPAPAKPGK
ncbi:MAG: c-type cytochrome [Candidatus Acidiferrales bacterium]